MPVLKMKSRPFLFVSLMFFAFFATNVNSLNDNVVDFRLPTNVIPIYYTLELVPSFTAVKSLGDITIDLTVLESNVSRIILHASNLEFNNDSFSLKNGLNSKIAIDNVDTETNKDKELIVINLSESIDEGNYTLEIQYSFVVSSDLYGFYTSHYDENGTNVVLGTTQFEPTYARRAFPCFDEPSFKARYKISITHDKKYTTVLGNFPEHRTELADDDTVITKFDTTDPISSYLIAFIVSEFTVKNSTDGAPVRIVGRDNIIQLGWADYALSIGPKSIAYMAQYTDVNFDYKTDLVAIPDFAAGAMENWGLITFREEDLLFDPKESTTANQFSVATVVTHELAHMWFGDMVTLDWWDHVWLNEGFATFFQYFATQGVIDPDQNSWGVNEQFIIVNVQAAMIMDGFSTALPPTNPVQTSAEIKNGFNDAAYNKAGSLLRMMEMAMGPSTFQKGLQSYQKDLHFQNGSPEKLYYHLQRAADEDNVDLFVSGILTSFMDQPGVPVVNVRLAENGSVTLNQERFYFIKNDSAIPQYWYIPVTFMCQNDSNVNTSTKLVLPKVDVEVEVKVTDKEVSDLFWVIFNVNEVGYYRVNYDTTLWNALKTALQKPNFDNIPEINRAQILDDLFNLARAGIVDYNLAMDTMQYLKSEDKYTPWKAINIAFKYVANRMIQDPDTMQKLSDFYLDQVDPIYKKYNLDRDTSNDTNIEKLLRESVASAACSFGNNDCVTSAITKFKGWKQNPSNRIYPADIRGIVYCNGIRNGTTDDWTFLWNQFGVVSLENVIILNALGCSKDENVLKTYLSYTLDPTKIRSQDTAYVYNSVYSKSAIGVNVTWEFFENNFDAMIESFGGFGGIGSIINGLAAYLTTQDQVDQFTKFINDNRGRAMIAVIADNVIEIANEGLDWNKKYSNTIITYLKNYTSGALANSISVLTLMFICIWNYFV